MPSNILVAITTELLLVKDAKASLGVPYKNRLNIGACARVNVM